MRVLVCGGRTYQDIGFVFSRLDVIHKRLTITAIIHGNAMGADTLAGAWATRHRIQCERYPADWDTHGRRAGPVRNAQMLREGKPDLVVAFPGGVGTADMIAQSKRVGVHTICL